MLNRMAYINSFVHFGKLVRQEVPKCQKNQTEAPKTKTLGLIEGENTKAKIAYALPIKSGTSSPQVCVGDTEKNN